MTRKYRIHGKENADMSETKDYIEIDSLKLDEDLKVYKVVNKTTKKINLGGGVIDSGNRDSSV